MQALVNFLLMAEPLARKDWDAHPCQEKNPLRGQLAFASGLCKRF